MAKHTAGEWRALAREAALAVAVELALPSGMTVMARRPSAEQFAQWGVLPLGLASVANGGGAGEVTDEAVLSLMEYQRTMLGYVLVEPRVSLDPRGEEEIHPRDIPDEDLRFILRWASRAEEAEKLRPFRRRGEAGVAGDGGAGIRAAAERDAGDRGPGDGAGSGPGGGVRIIDAG